MTKVLCKVLKHVHEFPLPENPKIKKKAGDFVRLDLTEANLQISANNVGLVNDEDLKILEANINPDATKKAMDDINLQDAISLASQKDNEIERLKLMVEQLQKNQIVINSPEIKKEEVKEVEEEVIDIETEIKTDTKPVKKGGK